MGVIRKIIYFLTTLLALFACEQEGHKEYYSDGNKFFEVPLKNGRFNGKGTYYYENGKVLEESNWLDGKKDGKSIIYFRNGRIRVEEYFESNYVDGLITHYDSLGNIISKVNYKKGLKEGYFEEYYPSGVLHTKGYHKNDKPYRNLYFYKENGEIKERWYCEYDGLYLQVFDGEDKLIRSSLPIEVSIDRKDVKGDSIKVKIELLHSSVDSLKLGIGVIFGTLKDNLLTDTLGWVFVNNNRLVEKYFFTNDKDSIVVSGILVENEMPGYNVKGKSVFLHKFTTSPSIPTKSK